MRLLQRFANWLGRPALSSRARPASRRHLVRLCLENLEDRLTPSAVSWDSGVKMAGASFSQTFNTAGTYPYHCSVHPFMKGTVVVKGP